MRFWMLWLFVSSLTSSGATLPTITAEQIPDGMAGQPYSFQLQATGGTPPYSWKATDIRQYGIEFDSATGLLHGNPLALGLGITATVTDAAGQTAVGFYRFHFWGPIQVLDNLPT